MDNQAGRKFLPVHKHSAAPYAAASTCRPHSQLLPPMHHAPTTAGPTPAPHAAPPDCRRSRAFTASTCPQARRAILLDGRAKSSEWLSELQGSVRDVASHLNRPPGLCVVMAGDRADSHVYVSRKEEACKQVCRCCCPWQACCAASHLFVALCKTWVVCTQTCAHSWRNRWLRR